MKAITKKILIASVCLIAGGAMLCGIAVLFGGRPGFTLNNTGIYSHSSHQAIVLKKTKLDPFSEADISIGSSADIHILPSRDNHYYLEYRLDNSSGAPIYKSIGNKLSIYQPDKRHGLSYSFAMFADARNGYVNLYVPEDQILDTLDMKITNGDITMANIGIKQAVITSYDGDVILKAGSFGSLKLTMDSGDFTMNGTKADNLTFENEDGDSTLNHLQCSTAKLSLDSGSLYLDAAQIKDLNVNSGDGDVTLLLPNSLKTYSFDVTTNDGDIYVPNDASYSYSKDHEDDTLHYQTEGTSANTIKVHDSSGDIKIRERH